MHCIDHKIGHFYQNKHSLPSGGVSGEDKRVMKTKTKKYKKAMLGSKNWRDMFENEDEPIFDSSDSDESSSNEV